jgi:hypothetical protein
LEDKVNEPARKKELFQIAGDAPDPTGATGARGHMAGVNFTQTAFGRPWVKVPHPVGEDRWLEVDVYKLEGEPMYIHLICPMCGNALRITQDQKAIDYDPHRPPPIAAELRALNPQAAVDGTLSVEAFACTWEEEPDLKRDFGFAKCGWRVAIDRNVARTA